MTISEIGALLRTRQLSCVALIRNTIADIQKRDHFHSFITLTPEKALAEAEERDDELADGIDRGPLHGIPTAYKDIFHTEGIRTTGGSLLYRDFVPEEDAVAVQRLEAAGAICIGKTNLHELAYGATSNNPHYGPVLNPSDPARVAGGSSGGSASAIAAGFVPMTLGTDTGGSIRIPASFCGVVGFKPTFDLVSRRGVMPLAFSLDHVGPLGSSVDDCVAAMQVIANRWHPSTLESLESLRVCLPENFFFDRVDSEVALAVRHSAGLLENAGADVESMQIPDLHEANVAARVVQFAEATAVYSQQTDRKLFGSDVWALLQQGKRVAGHEYVNAQRVRSQFRRAFNRLWNKVDVILAPTTAIPAPLVEETTVRIGLEQEDTRIASTRLVRAVAFLGEPAISIPCGRTKSGLPIGLQLIAAPGQDARLLQIAKFVEKLLAFER